MGSDTSHKNLINDADYLQGIRDIYPDQTEEFYQAIKYVGCADEVSKLSPSEQQRINTIIQYTIYNQH